MINTSVLSGNQEPEDHRWLFFAPPQFEVLPPEHQDQILFLDAASTDAVFENVNAIDILCDNDGWGNKPFSGGCYESVEYFRMQWVEAMQHSEVEFDGEPWYPLVLSNESELKKWLYQRGLTFKSEVLLLKTFGTESDPALLTTWKMVVKYADTFFSGDNAIFFNPALTWCLHYHHDGILHFARNRKH